MPKKENKKSKGQIFANWKSLLSTHPNAHWKQNKHLQISKE